MWRCTKFEIDALLRSSLYILASLRSVSLVLCPAVVLACSRLSQDLL